MIKLFSIITLNHADVVIVDPLSFFAILPYIALSRLKIIKTQFVLDVRSHPVSNKGLVGKIRVFQHSVVMQLSTIIIKNYTFLTPLMAKEQIEKYRISLNSKRIGYWGCGVNLDHFSPEKYKNKAKEIRKDKNLDGKFIVIYHGVLSPNRGLENAVLAMKKVAKYNSNIVLVLLGDGSVRKTLQQLIINNRLVDNVIVIPPVEHSLVPAYISSADVSIIPLPNHPDWRSQQPIKLSEYLAMKKVVIATDIPAHTDILANQKSGLITKDNKPDSLADAIIECYKNRSNLIVWGNNGRHLTISKKLTWDSIALDLQKFLLSIKDVG